MPYEPYPAATELFIWYDESRVRACGIHPQSDLPRPLFEALVSGSTKYGNDKRSYLTREAALLDLTGAEILLAPKAPEPPAATKLEKWLRRSGDNKVTIRAASGGFVLTADCPASDALACGPAILDAIKNAEALCI